MLMKFQYFKCDKDNKGEMLFSKRATLEMMLAPDKNKLEETERAKALRQNDRSTVGEQS